MRVDRLSACAAGVAEGETPGLIVADGVAVGLTVGLELGVGLGLGVPVAVAVGVALGVGAQASGAMIPIVVGVPVLKNPIVAAVLTGARSESNRKLYIVPQRIAFAFWFWAKVSELHVTAKAV